MGCFAVVRIVGFCGTSLAAAGWGSRKHPSLFDFDLIRYVFISGPYQFCNFWKFQTDNQARLKIRP